MSLKPQLPAYGWTEHSEQIDAASLAARCWQMSTRLVGGRVITALLGVEACQGAKLEEVAKARAEHRKSCADPGCPFLVEGAFIDVLCPDGKFDPSKHVFYTTAFLLNGEPLHPLRTVSYTPEGAIESHYAACAMLTGVLATWDLRTERQ